MRTKCLSAFGYVSAIAGFVLSMLGDWYTISGLCLMGLSAYVMNATGQLNNRV